MTRAKFINLVCEWLNDSAARRRILDNERSRILVLGAFDFSQRYTDQQHACLDTPPPNQGVNADRRIIERRTHSHTGPACDTPPPASEPTRVLVLLSLSTPGRTDRIIAADMQREQAWVMVRDVPWARWLPDARVGIGPDEAVLAARGIQ